MTLCASIIIAFTILGVWMFLQACTNHRDRLCATAFVAGFFVGMLVATLMR